MWIDGKMLPSSEATVHVLSHGMQRGSTVFDVLKVVPAVDGASAFGLREHVARFSRSMDLMGMKSPFGIGELEQGVSDAVAANPGSTVVKLAAAWVEVPLRSLPVSVVPTVFIAALGGTGEVVDPGGAKSVVSVRSATAPKMPANILPPSLKVAASYTVGVRERLGAVAAGFDDVVFRTVDGDLAEGTTQSLFVIRANEIVVPPLDSVLDGITRRAVLDVARHQRHVVHTRHVPWDEVVAADELFLSSTNTPVLPVERLDDQRYLAPGPVSMALDEAMAELLAGRHELSARWLTPLF